MEKLDHIPEGWFVHRELRKDGSVILKVCHYFDDKRTFEDDLQILVEPEPSPWERLFPEFWGSFETRLRKAIERCQKRAAQLNSQYAAANRLNYQMDREAKADP